MITHYHEGKPMKTMSTTTANILFGGPPAADFDHDIYQLTKLADRIVVALSDSHPRPALRHAITEDLMIRAFVPPNRPELKFTMPMPDWNKL